MIVSFNEIAAMGKRAARGAEMTWGLAEEAGRSARWLAEHGLPGPELLADLLDEPGASPVSVDGTWSAPGGSLCPIVAGTALSDRAHELAAGRVIQLGPTAQPALLAAFVASASSLTDTVIELAWDGVVMTFGPQGVAIVGTNAALVAPIAESTTCRQTNAVRDATAPTTRGWDVDSARWDRLVEFAHRTLAPSTEQSRLAGAGADLIDD